MRGNFLEQEVKLGCGSQCELRSPPHLWYECCRALRIESEEIGPRLTRQASSAPIPIFSFGFRPTIRLCFHIHCRFEGLLMYSSPTHSHANATVSPIILAQYVSVASRVPHYDLVRGDAGALVLRCYEPWASSICSACLYFKLWSAFLSSPNFGNESGWRAAVSNMCAEQLTFGV